ncbi:hypothetical protein BDV93DRAFT_564652 [Ceratobasidium sp. AG-I]|nr:hypothetical protein BDV93DRAFT_564652 [Ceratobasidium sp. AG-I]
MPLQRDHSQQKLPEIAATSGQAYALWTCPWCTQTLQAWGSGPTRHEEACVVRKLAQEHDANNGTSVNLPGVTADAASKLEDQRLREVAELLDDTRMAELPDTSPSSEEDTSVGQNPGASDDIMMTDPGDLLADLLEWRSQRPRDRVVNPGSPAVMTHPVFLWLVPSFSWLMT